MLPGGDVRAAETFAVQSPRRDHRANPHANCHGERYEDRRGRYTKDSWSVYYRGRKVEGASVSSFADLGGGYGKDNWTVYYRGWKVEGASASSFADLGGGYGKDNWTVFYEGRKLEGASAMSFEYKGRGYGKDNWNTYFRGEQLRPGQSPDGMLGGGYGAKGRFFVVGYGKKVIGTRERSSFEGVCGKVYGEIVPGAGRRSVFRTGPGRFALYMGGFLCRKPFFTPCRVGIRALVFVFAG